MKAYQSSIESIVTELKSSLNRGLSQEEIAQRKEQYGSNTLKVIKQKGLISIFVSQFRDPLVYILFFAALIIFIFGEDKIDAFVISGVLMFNAVLGTIQEYRTKRIIENLKQFIKTESVVLRNGEKIVIDEKDMVVGDIIFLQEGQRIPADARIIISNNLKIDEAVLTGEAHTVTKNSDPITTTMPLGDRKNMIFKGTYIVAGSGQAIITAVGSSTEIGKIQLMSEEIDTDIPLRKELEHLSHLILLFIVITCGFLFAIGIFTGKPIKELLVMLTALFICVIPEGLPVVLTLILATGALRMAKRSVLVRNMQAVEALGRTNVIVIDKTGTLTRNEMVVSRVWTAQAHWSVTGHGYHCEGEVCQNGTIDKNIGADSALVNMGIASALLNSAEVIHLPKLDTFEIKGDPTEAALFIFSQKMGTIIADQLGEYENI